MFTDILGKKRLKINLHTHTTRTDGQKAPEEVAAIYKARGYDAVALTDHWKYNPGGEMSGLQMISGVEYNVGGGDAADPVFHIVALGCETEPVIDSAWTHLSPYEGAAKIIAAIRNAGGVANLAHPAWSLNTPEMLMRIQGGFDVTEVYNSVSDYGMSDRANSEVIIDQLATAGCIVPMLATDDAHYYTGDECRGFIALEKDACDELGFAGAVRAGRFYASMGPEVHFERLPDGSFRVQCTPCAKIEFMSNMVWTSGRIVRGENLTEATYRPQNGERFIRAVVVDDCGNRAWSNIIAI